jgi:hypothetical protein
MKWNYKEEQEKNDKSVYTKLITFVLGPICSNCNKTFDMSPRAFCVTQEAS